MLIWVCIVKDYYRLVSEDNILLHGVLLYPYPFACNVLYNNTGLLHYVVSKTKGTEGHQHGHFQLLSNKIK